MVNDAYVNGQTTVLFFSRYRSQVFVFRSALSNKTIESRDQIFALCRRQNFSTPFRLTFWDHQPIDMVIYETSMRQIDATSYRCQGYPPSSPGTVLFLRSKWARGETGVARGRSTNSHLNRVFISFIHFKTTFFFVYTRQYVLCGNTFAGNSFLRYNLN